MVKKETVSGILVGENVITEDSDAARDFYSQSCYGDIKNKKVQLSLLESYYLMQKGRLEVKSENGRKISDDSFLRKAKKIQKKFNIRYAVFKDFRDRGYVIKTALKFGAEFRVYDRGIKPGEDHAKWIVFPVHEAEALTWYDFSAKNRVAHSTKKRLLLGIVDDEGDVTFYETRWIRP